MIRTKDGECRQLPGHVRRQLMRSGQTAGRFALAHIKARPTSVTPLYRHSREEELFFVSSGEFLFEIEGNTFELGAGDFVLAPPLALRGYSCKSEEGGDLYCAMCPAGPEDFWRDLTAQHAQGSIITSELEIIGRKYGISFEARSVADTPKAEVVRVGEGVWSQTPNSRTRTIIDRRAGDFRYSVREIESQPLGFSPMEQCEFEDKVFLLREGRFEFCLDDARVHAGMGEVVYIPRGVEHSFRVVSAAPGRFILFTVSATLTEY